jgi:two-component system response regulator YesN
MCYTYRNGLNNRGCGANLFWGAAEMLKIYFAEDDAAIRESMIRNVKWEHHGYEFVGQAPDGEIAYSEIQILRPDVIITDLKMPFMDGLELSRLVRKETPEAKIIILTGYNDFESVQEALHIGVAKYLLKPVTPEALVKTIVDMRKLILEEQEHRAHRERYIEDMAELRDLKLRNFFENWMEGSKKVYELLDIASQFGISLNASSYSVIRFQLFLSDGSQAYSENLEKLYNRIERALCESDKILLFKQGLQGWVLILKGDKQEASGELAKKISAKLEGLLADQEAVHYIIAVGTQIMRLQDIAKSYNSASHAYAYRYIFSGNALVFADELPEADGRKDSGLKLGNADITKIGRVDVERFLRSGTAGDVQALVDELFSSVGQHNLQSFLLRQYIVMDINSVVMDFLDKIGVDSSLIFKHFGKIQLQASELTTISGTRRYLTELIKCAVQLRNDSVNKRYDRSVEKAQEYIREHYSSEAISLNSVSKFVNLSPTHFSTVFSQESGKTFTEFLTEVRMEKAKELLLCSPKRSYEIAYEVGYRDPHYFSYVFKKIIGCSPREFRANGKAD